MKNKLPTCNVCKREIDTSRTLKESKGIAFIERHSFLKRGWYCAVCWKILWAAAKKLMQLYSKKK